MLNVRHVVVDRCALQQTERCLQRHRLGSGPRLTYLVRPVRMWSPGRVLDRLFLSGAV
jgi:hypothetical protein